MSYGLEKISKMLVRLHVNDRQSNDVLWFYGVKIRKVL